MNDAIGNLLDFIVAATGLLNSLLIASGSLLVN